MSEQGVRLGLRKGACRVAAEGRGALLLLNARRMRGALPQPSSARQGALVPVSQEKKSVSPGAQEAPRKRDSLSPDQLLGAAGSQ